MGRPLWKYMARTQIIRNIERGHLSKRNKQKTDNQWSRLSCIILLIPTGRKTFFPQGRIPRQLTSFPETLQHLSSEKLASNLIASYTSIDGMFAHHTGKIPGTTTVSVILLFKVILIGILFIFSVLGNRISRLKNYILVLETGAKTTDAKPLCRFWDNVTEIGWQPIPAHKSTSHLSVVRTASEISVSVS